jgi:phenylalanyl-tRNA synthetase beta chain
MPDLLLLLEKNAELGAFRLFEHGRTYLKDFPEEPGSLPVEERRLAVVVYDKGWKRSGHQALLQVRGILDGLMARLQFPAVQIVPVGDDDAAARHPWAHPGRSATVALDGVAIGHQAEVHPRVMAELGVPGRAGYFDIDIEKLLGVGRRSVTFRELPRFPVVTIDMSLLCPETAVVAELVRHAAQNGGELLDDASLLAIYRGKNLPAGKKSVTLRLIYRHAERTLTDEEVFAARDGLIATFGEMGLEIR